jgi:DNA-binding protein H-NS
MARPRKSSTTYAELQAQIAKLQAQAEDLRKSEVGQVVAQIRAAIAHYRLTAVDLGFASSAPAGKRGKAAKAAPAPAAGKRAAKTAKKAKKFTVPVRYRDDKGNTWTGRGNKPRWLVAAMAEGKKQEDFLLK